LAADGRRWRLAGARVARDRVPGQFFGYFFSAKKVTRVKEKIKKQKLNPLGAEPLAPPTRHNISYTSKMS
jgi:hypothetical protein